MSSIIVTVKVIYDLLEFFVSVSVCFARYRYRIDFAKYRIDIAKYRIDIV